MKTSQFIIKHLLTLLLIRPKLVYAVITPILFIAFFLTFVPSISNAAQVTFGTTTIGGTTDTGDGNSITCNQYTASATGKVTSLHAAVGTVDSTKESYSLALYADANNSPTNLLGYQVGTLTANTWNTVNVSIPVTSGTKYWICYNTNTSNTTYNNLKYKSSSTILALYKSQSYGSWPSSFGSVGGRWKDAYSVYATVETNTTPTNTPTPTLVPPTPTATPAPTVIVPPTSTPTPTLAPPTSTPTIVPTTQPTIQPTVSPTVTPTVQPTPTNIPSPTTIPISSTFGTTTVGGTTDTGDGNSITCNQYIANATGAVTSMSVNVGPIDSASKNYSLALYADTNNNPTTYLGSATGTLTANTWNTLGMNIPVTTNTKYWLCYNTSTSNTAYNNVRYASGSTPALYKSQSYGNWPSPFGTVGGKWTDAYSLYATITQGEGTVPTPTTTIAPSVVPTETITPTQTPTVTPTPGSGSVVISRNVPAFASSGTAANANDANYNTTWRSSSTNATLAYDLSGIPTEKRNNVLLVWYNEETDAYDPIMAQESAIEYPKDYTIQTNSAPSGSSAPTSGWTTKATITGNKYHSRQHVIGMDGANWIRINVTGVNGGSSTNINMDIYDASTGTADNWVIYGSSTPSMSMNHTNLGTLTKSFSQMINESHPNNFPVQENGSISGINTEDGVAHMDEWLAIFPGKYVAIALGANDASECMDPNTFYNNYVTMINKVTNAGKTPVIPLFNWSKDSSVQSCGPSLIEKINLLYTNYPQVIKGPDYWNYYKSHPELISSDNTHPTTEGLAIYRQMWAQTASANAYNR